MSGWTSPNGSQHLTSSSLDQSVSVWSADDGKLKFNLRGTSKPVHCLCITSVGELVTATTANRIGVYTSLTNNANFSSTKLRSDTFEGRCTSQSYVTLGIRYGRSQLIVLKTPEIIWSVVSVLFLLFWLSFLLVL